VTISGKVVLVQLDLCYVEINEGFKLYLKLSNVGVTGSVYSAGVSRHMQSGYTVTVCCSTSSQRPTNGVLTVHMRCCY